MWSETRLGVIGSVDSGKCFARDTPILMKNGKVKMIQDIKIGEFVLGDDNIVGKQVRMLVRGFTWFWNSRYDGLNIRNIDHIKSISKDNALVYVPCHRSHIDYCALTFILYENGLMLPQIAAGNNLNLPVLGSILRGAGAIFMRLSLIHI